MVMFVRGIEDREVPDMIPVDESIDRPIGRDPDEVENDKSSPLTVGMMENDSPTDLIYVELG